MKCVLVIFEGGPRFLAVYTTVLVGGVFINHVEILILVSREVIERKEGMAFH